MSILKLFKRKSESLVINNEFGTFVLQRPGKDRAYKGTISWLDTEAIVNLELDNNEDLTTDKALKHLRKIAANATEWDRKIRRYAAEDMADSDGMIEIWENNDDADSDFSCITKEEFISRISIGFIYIYRNGELFLTMIWTECLLIMVWGLMQIFQVKFCRLQYGDRNCIFAKFQFTKLKERPRIAPFYIFNALYICR